MRVRRFLLVGPFRLYFVRGVSMAAMVLGWGTAQAVPLVSHVAGTIADGASLTIAGTGFGTTGPNIVLFDDFDGGADGNPLSNSVVNAKVGIWRDVSSGIGPYYPTYSTLQSHSGLLALRQNWGSGSGQQEGGRWAAPAIAGTIQQIYFSFWTYLPMGQNVPGACCGIGANWKVWWLSSDDMVQNDFASEIITDPPASTSLCWVDGTQNRGCYGYAPFDFQKGRWQRWEVFLTGSTTNGTGKLWFTHSGGARILWGSISGRTLDDGTSGWGYLHFPGFGRYDSNSNTFYDDVYVSTGPGAQARVEIGDSPTYAGSSNLAVSTVTSWSDGVIEATVRAGSFSSGAAYLYVVDANGEVNANGYPVALGAPAQSQPSPPKGFRVR